MSTRNHNTGDYVHSLSTNSQLNIIQRYKLLTNIHTYKTLITPYEQKPESYSYSSTRSLRRSTLWHEGTKCGAPPEQRRLRAVPEPRVAAARYNDNVESVSGIRCAFLSREVSLESSRAAPEANTRDREVRPRRRAHTEIS